ncbi:hypothetical protein [Gynurincola endophyticus]|uniref:hypothetical protein n=1 Tax=Gynurincola endophyticus TaxID=2479004 RepID=UPI000F8F378C|nr:hypothetical protein [Gynurincola endophyticus]
MKKLLFCFMLLVGSMWAMAGSVTEQGKFYYSDSVKIINAPEDLRTIPATPNTLYITYQGDVFFHDLSNTNADNGYTIIVNHLNQRFRKKLENYIYPEWFGAKGDGVSDDAIAFNKMFKFLELMNPAPTYRVFKVGFQSGSYLINDTVHLPHRIGKVNYVPNTLLIDGYGVVLRTTQPGNVIFYRSFQNFDQANSIISDHRLILQGLSFVGPGVIDIGSKALDIGAYYGASFKDIYVSRFDTGFVSRFMVKCKFDNILFNQNRSVALVGASYRDVLPGATVMNSSFNSNTISNIRNYALQGSFASVILLGTDQTLIENSVFEGDKPTYHIYMDDQSNTGQVITKIERIWFESKNGLDPETLMYLKFRGTLLLSEIQRTHPDVLFMADLAPGAILRIENIPHMGGNVEKPFVWLSNPTGRKLEVKNVANSEWFLDTSKYVGQPPQNSVIDRWLPANSGYQTIYNGNPSFLVNPNEPPSSRVVSVSGTYLYDVDNVYDIGQRAAILRRPRRALIGTGGYGAQINNNAGGFWFYKVNGDGSYTENVAAAWRARNDSVTYIFGSTGGFDLPRGTTLQRSINYAGRFRWNTDSSKIEVNNGTRWLNVLTNLEVNRDTIANVASTFLPLQLTSTYTAMAADATKMIFIDAATSLVNLNINPAVFANRTIQVFCKNASFTARINPTTGSINGAANYDMALNEYVKVYSDGTNLYILK